MKTIYIAGQMRNIQYYNFARFFKAEYYLVYLGWNVINPAQHDMENGIDPFKFPDDFDWSQEPSGRLKEIVKRDLLYIVNSCDAIYMLVGWEQSYGARAEHAVAEWLNLEIIHENI